MKASIITKQLQRYSNVQQKCTENTNIYIINIIFNIILYTYTRKSNNNELHSWHNCNNAFNMVMFNNITVRRKGGKE